MSDALTVVIYAAKSTADEKGSIPDQIAACKDFAASRGWTVDSVESDEAASAYSGNRGDGLEDALSRAAELADSGTRAGILVWHSNRIARGGGDAISRHLIEYVFLANRGGFELHSVQDDSTFTNPILAAVMGEMAHQESKIKAANVRKGMDRRRKLGLHTGGAIFGYDRDPETGLTPNADQAPVVRRIFNLIAGGKSQAEVARILNRDGIKPLKGSGWQQGSLSVMIQRRTYLGEIQDGEGGWKPALHDAIVDADVWKAANAKREAAARRRGRGGGPRPKAGHLLPGKVLRHRSCGWAMTPVSLDAKKDGTVTGVYECSGRKGGVCDGFRVSMDSVDESIISYLAEVGIDAGESLRLIQEATAATVESRKAALESARAEVGRIEVERARMWRLFKAGDLDPDDWREFKAEHADEKAAAEATVKRLEDQTASEADPAALVPAAATALDLIRASIATGDSDAVRSALAALFDHFQIDAVENMPEQVVMASAEDMQAARVALREQIAKVEAQAGRTVAEADAAYWAEQAAEDAPEPPPDNTPELDPAGLMILPVPREDALASIIEDGQPVRLVDERGRAVYRRIPLPSAGLGPATNNNGLLVQYRDYHGVRPSELELVEEFRLVFNLWEDRATRTFYSFDESGNAVKAAVIDSEGVRVLTSLVRRYQAAKQMHLALFIDSTRWSSDLDSDELRAELRDDGVNLSYYRGGGGALMDKPFSRLFGKRLLSPPPVEKSGLPPYEKEKDYQDFVVAISDTGEEILFSSDPSNLADYFGGNQGNPHYLTPVYFRRDVMNKYFADPDRYTVGDGLLRCAGLWSVRLDNDQAGHVMVFLGDLGRDIPAAEARYWRSYNIPPPEEGPSETLVRRAFRAEFADPQSADLLFPSAYREANKSWEKAFGHALFKELHDDDRHIMKKLHVPVSDGAAEFDEQILYLAKLLVDSLNEEALTQALGKGSKGEKGLAKLERFLQESGVDDPRGLLRPFANVQGLRSRGAAHRKGSEFDIAQAIGAMTRPQGFERLLTDCMDTLEALRGFADGAGAEHSGPAAEG